jgi:hypothetical protein
LIRTGIDSSPLPLDAKTSRLIVGDQAVRWIPEHETGDNHDNYEFQHFAATIRSYFDEKST